MRNLHFYWLVEMMCAQLKVKSTTLYSEEETAVSKLSICIIKWLNVDGKILTKSLIVWGWLTQLLEIWNHWQRCQMWGRNVPNFISVINPMCLRQAVVLQLYFYYPINLFLDELNVCHYSLFMFPLFWKLLLFFLQKTCSVSRRVNLSFEALSVSFVRESLFISSFNIAR